MCFFFFYIGALLFSIHDVNQNDRKEEKIETVLMSSEPQPGPSSTK